MLLNSRLAAFVAILSAFPGYAADICSYTNRNCRSTTFGCCSNVPLGVCCFWQYDFLGWSVQFRNVTGNWIGNTYTDTACGVQVGATGASAGATGACVSVPATSTVNWFSGRHVIDGTVVTPGAKAGDKAECRAPDVLGFSYSGKEYHVNVPEGQFESIARLLQAEEYEALREIAREV